MDGSVAHPDAASRRAPRWLFKVVDIASGDCLAQDATARTTIDALVTVESIHDVWIFVWHPTLNTWRLLSTGERRSLWEFRGR